MTRLALKEWKITLSFFDTVLFFLIFVRLSEIYFAAQRNQILQYKIKKRPNIDIYL